MLATRCGAFFVTSRANASKLFFLFPPPARRRRRSSATGSCSTVAAAPRQPVRPPSSSSSSSMIPTRLFTLDYYLHLLHASPDANNPEVYGEVSDPEEPAARTSSPWNEVPAVALQTTVTIFATTSPSYTTSCGGPILPRCLTRSRPPPVFLAASSSLVPRQDAVRLPTIPEATAATSSFPFTCAAAIAFYSHTSTPFNIGLALCKMA
ncbi:hypothetical protein C8J57DRAFT_1601632 [Mycena rebaudengoi]|nr:hypothetical protein C8J57DRAFT_1601632 [Mycena rebaudengoi]